MHVEPDDPQSVLWLQQALTRLIPRTIVRMGTYDELTHKAVRNYQRSKALPQTGEADDVTTNLIAQDLAQLP